MPKAGTGRTSVRRILTESKKKIDQTGVPQTLIEKSTIAEV
jgi:hypothetical protein